ncbi:MAG: hypothetical protein ACLF0G_14745 [Candidatus Brocadiia bacterium]
MHKRTLYTLGLLAGGLALAASLVWACSVPVYRYALERWPADYYEVVVAHRGPLSTEDQAVVDWLGKCAEGKETACNIALRVVDLDQEEKGVPDEERAQALWEARGKPDLPWMLVRYPWTSRIPQDAWSGPLSLEAVQGLVGSPARREMAEKLVGGDTAVWLFLESGKKDQDAKAAKTLGKTLKEMEKELRLPMPPEYYYQQEAGEEDPDAPKPDLSVSFPIVRLSRDEPKEKMFVNLLLSVEPDLKDLDQPMAFCVFGRGRALYPLVGEGINEDNIIPRAAFLCGPCSCTIKGAAPGFDLPMAVAWDASLMEQEMVGVDLPPLDDVLTMVAAASAPRPSAGGKTESPEAAAEESLEVDLPEADSGALWRNVLIAAGAGVGVLALAGAVVWGRRNHLRG